MQMPWLNLWLSLAMSYLFVYVSVTRDVALLRCVTMTQARITTFSLPASGRLTLVRFQSNQTQKHLQDSPSTTTLNRAITFCHWWWPVRPACHNRPIWPASHLLWLVHSCVTSRRSLTCRTALNEHWRGFCSEWHSADSTFKKRSIEGEGYSKANYIDININVKNAMQTSSTGRGCGRAFLESAEERSLRDEERETLRRSVAVPRPDHIRTQWHRRVGLSHHYKVTADQQARWRVVQRSYAQRYVDQRRCDVVWRTPTHADRQCFQTACLTGLSTDVRYQYLASQ